MNYFCIRKLPFCTKKLFTNNSTSYCPTAIPAFQYKQPKVFEFSLEEVAPVVLLRQMRRNELPQYCGDGIQLTQISVTGLVNINLDNVH